MKLEKNKKQTLEFDIAIEGASSKNSIPRFVLTENNISLSFLGTIDDGKCKFEVDRLEIFEGRQIEGQVEVIVENNKYFSPWKKSIELESPVLVKISESKDSSPLTVSTKDPVIKEVKIPKIIKEEDNYRYRNKKGIQEVYVVKVLEESTQNAKLKVITKSGKLKTIKINKNSK